MNRSLGSLTEVSLREAWEHEALSFTPWLSQHLDELANIVGLPLELIGSEVAVSTFSADILARNPQDDSLVLIENQLDVTDHTHLGQIMTYLAGLEAQTIIWIAAGFREPHLSALNWLNEHTTDQFSFFAVKVKAVRIGVSPIAPVFEIVLKPNEWERQLQAISKETKQPSKLGQFRHEFWSFYLKRFPEEASFGEASLGSNRRRTFPELKVDISYYVSRQSVGIFLTKPRGGSDIETDTVLLKHEDELYHHLGGHVRELDFGQARKADLTDRSIWPELCDWLHDKVELYQTTLTKIGKTEI